MLLVGLKVERCVDARQLVLGEFLYSQASAPLSASIATTLQTRSKFGRSFVMRLNNSWCMPEETLFLVFLHCIPAGRRLGEEQEQLLTSLPVCSNVLARRSCRYKQAGNES